MLLRMLPRRSLSRRKMCVRKARLPSMARKVSMFIRKAASRRLTTLHKERRSRPTQQKATRCCNTTNRRSSISLQNRTTDYAPRPKTALRIEIWNLVPPTMPEQAQEALSSPTTATLSSVVPVLRLCRPVNRHKPCLAIPKDAGTIPKIRPHKTKMMTTSSRLRNCDDEAP